MKYEEWVQEVYAAPPGVDPTMYDLSHTATHLDELLLLDYMQRSFSDLSIVEQFSKEQIGVGLSLVFSNCCSDYPFVFIGPGHEAEKVRAIESIAAVYEHYFETLCVDPVHKIGDAADGRMGFICYMLWDIFVLDPAVDGVSSAMLDAGLGVMGKALQSKNDNVLVSALHGLGHWGEDLPEAAALVRAWKKAPTTSNPCILEYADNAEDGYVL